MQYDNSIEFQVSGEYALFSNPINRIGGEKCSYQIPTYEAIKGVLHSIYWKPTIIWVIDSIRIMNMIQMETKGIRTIKNNGPGVDLSYYTYLKDCKYQVKAHFIWNENRPNLKDDRNEHKHYAIANRMIAAGGRRDIYLGTRECQAYVEPCTFGEGKGYYDTIPVIDFGIMYHGITYADEAYSKETQDKMSIRLWHPLMHNGYINFEKPERCIHKYVRDMEIKPFDKKLNNFTDCIEEGKINGLD